MTSRGHNVLFGKFLIPLLTAAVLLSSCDSDTTLTEQPETGSGLEFQLPEKIRSSLAVDFDRVSGIANVNGRNFQMERNGDSFVATVPDVPANSEVSINLLFQETLTDGRVLNLASTDSDSFSIGTVDRTIAITEDQFSYAFDDDNDQISNIAERNDGTDPFTPENAGSRTITVQFNLPLRIADPAITIVTAIIADIPRAMSSQGNFIQITGQVSTLNTIDIDIRLEQILGDNTVPLAQAIDQVDPGAQDFTLSLMDSDFDFSVDSDQDGIPNIDEVQSGTNPFIAE